MASTVNIDKHKIKQVMIAMATAVYNDVEDILQDRIIEEKRTDYPNMTVRRYGRGITGKIAGSTRDVVDSGSLRDSKQSKIESNSNKVKFTIEWLASHASFIYAGTANQPPYPWVHLALREDIDWKQIFEKYRE